MFSDNGFDILLGWCYWAHGSSFLSGRIPVRLYVWSSNEDFDDLEDVPYFDSWDKIVYINRPVEIHGEGMLR